MEKGANLQPLSLGGAILYQVWLTTSRDSYMGDGQRVYKKHRLSRHLSLLYPFVDIGMGIGGKGGWALAKEYIYNISYSITIESPMMVL
jgi:hypothetical protein